MKASLAHQTRLLDLAVLDEDIRRAERARTSPAQGARVKELLAVRATQSSELTRLLGQRDDARAELARIESDVAVVDARSARDAERLAASTNAKDAQGLEHEIASLAKRKSDLEDAEIVIMERLEALDAEITGQEALIATTNDEGARLSAEGKRVVAEATAKLEAATRDRAAVAAELPADLLAMYERLASRGVGVGLLHERTCGGCRMVLSGTDLAKLRTVPEDEVVTCPECGGILVRNYDSGL